jgi:hypothetical protein
VGIATFALGASLLGGLSASAQNGQAPTAGPGIGPNSAFAVEKEAYVYGYPELVISETKDETFKDLTNHFVYVPRPATPSDRHQAAPISSSMARWNRLLRTGSPCRSEGCVPAT